MNIHESQLKQLKLCVYTILSEELKEYFFEKPEVGISILENFLTDSISLRVIQRVWGEEEKILTIKVVSSWWQFFKKQYFPRWLLKWFPVKYETARFSAKALYPKLALPDEPHSVIWYNKYHYGLEKLEGMEVE